MVGQIVALLKAKGARESWRRNSRPNQGDVASGWVASSGGVSMNTGVKTSRVGTSMNCVNVSTGTASASNKLMEGLTLQEVKQRVKSMREEDEETCAVEEKGSSASFDFVLG